ncbi:MAG TPA: DUF1127 domain-containing protein [Casimicrobiaceae bacterium]|nr:DUF1127 domain-containing protein [Casimicrobiaceae bacterium]
MRKPVDERAWARHALAGHGVGGALPTCDMAPGRAAAPAIVTPPPGARVRAFVLDAWRTLCAGLHALRARRRRSRDARAVYDALRQLDDRALHDLGFDRSELTSVAREATAGADYARAHPILSSDGILR